MVCNIGFIGIGKYKTRENKEYNKNYKTWLRMINRCYGKSTHNNQKSYEKCSVHPDWCNFQIFAEWYENNYIEGYVLDKDILIKNNKIYGPDTCCFVPQEINNLFLKRNKLRGDFPIGVCYHIKTKKFVALVSYNGQQKTFGCYNTPEEAFEIYKYNKELRIKELAIKYKSTITTECYSALVKYKVEPTD